jgi:hypothetical protein
MFEANRSEVCYYRSYVEAKEFRSIGRAYEYSECLLPDH